MTSEHKCPYCGATIKVVTIGCKNLADGLEPCFLSVQKLDNEGGGPP